MCSYREKKPDPTEFIQLEGFTIDYMPEPDPGKNTVFSKIERKKSLLLK